MAIYPKVAGPGKADLGFRSSGFTPKNKSNQARVASYRGMPMSLPELYVHSEHGAQKNRRWSYTHTDL